MLWFTIWFMVILKIPVLYLAYVIWWAVKDPPGSHAEPALVAAGPSPDEGDTGWLRRARRRRPGPRRGPHGSPRRRPARAAIARAHARR